MPSIDMAAVLLAAAMSMVIVPVMATVPVAEDIMSWSIVEDISIEDISIVAIFRTRAVEYADDVGIRSRLV